MGRPVCALLAGLALGCGTTEAPSASPAAPEPAAAALPPGWIPALLADPAAFDAAIGEGERSRWVAAHAGEWVPPREEEGPEPGFVAAQAQTERALGALEAALYQRLLLTWTERGELPPDAPLPWLAWLAALDAGDGAALAPLPELAAVDSLDTIPAEALPPDVAACRSAHAESRRRKTVAAPDACAALTGAQLPDPLARTTRAQALEALPTAQSEVAALAFTGRWSQEPAPCPVESGLAGWETEATALRAREDAVQSAALPGQALVEELQLAAGWRRRRLAGCALEALSAGTVEAAALLPRLEALVDAGLGERVGPTNPPIVFAALALARLHAGRSRATLDALHALRTTWVELPPLIELAGDHHVATGLGRDGDSKEH